MTKFITELGGITTGDMYVLEQEEENLFAIYGENLNTGSIKEHGEYSSLAEAMIAWKKLSISFNKKELKALWKKRKTAIKRMRSKDRRIRHRYKTRYQTLTKQMQATQDELNRLEAEEI